MIATFARDRVRLRAAPTTAANTLRYMDTGATATMLGDTPVHADMLDWWRVQADNGDVGWAAQKLGNVHLFKIEVAAFEVAVKFTLSREGGYVKDMHGETNFGINSQSHPGIDIKNLTVEQAKDIYYADYWLKARCYLYDYPKNLCLFDIAVISGIGRASALRNLDALGMVVEQSEFYTNIATFEVFGRGWIRRSNALQRIVNEAVRGK